MSEDLIKRSDAIKVVRHISMEFVDTDTRQKLIEAIPSADRPQGEWINKGDYAECSNCGADSGTQFDGVEPIPLTTKFCPNCGARMKGAGDE